jgi:alpha-mannosidase
VFNPLLLGRSCVVEITAADARGIETDDGQPVLSQKTADGLLALVEMAPASTRQLRSSTTATETPKSTWNVSARLLDNGMVKAVFDPNGRLKELTSNGRGLCLAAPGGFTLHPDRPAEFDAWDIDQPALRLGKEVADSIQLKVIEKGPVRAILRGRSDIGKNSRLTVDYILQANSPWLGVRVQVDWKEKQQLLKYHLPTGYLGSTARYGTPFGSIARPQLPGHPRNQAMWEVSANRWAALGHEDGSDGLAVITEAKYGFSCYEGDLGLSLLRSPMDPGNNGGQQVDHGHHDISFAIGRYAQQTQDNQLSTPAAAEALFGPLVVCQDGRKVACPFTLEQIGSLVPSWLMPAETGKGFVIRLHETVGGRGRALLRFEKPVRSVKLVDLLERPIGQLRKLTDDTWAIDYEPFKVISVMVKPA